MTRVKVLLAGFLAVVTAFVSSGAADAAPALQAPPDTQRRVVVGVVKAVDGTTVTLTTRSGEQVKVGITSDTSIRAPGKPQAALSDIAVGAGVSVVAQVKDSALTAISLVVNPVQTARRDVLERARRLSVARSAQALVRSLERELVQAPDAAKPDLQKALDAAKQAQTVVQDTLKKLPVIATPMRAVIRGTVTDVDAANGAITVQPGQASSARRAAPQGRGRLGPGMRGRNQRVPSMRARLARLPVTLTVTESAKLTRNADQQAKIADVKIGDIVVSGVYDRGTSEALRMVVMSPDFLVQLRGARQPQARGQFQRGFGPRGGAPRFAPAPPMR
ncbi:MAG: hypothetical protein Q7T26_06710 [Dehalococcoidia bacterium]|nr:hypothetical protein [Dehalococcoidia bacterium]